MHTSRVAKSVALAGMVALLGACAEKATAPGAGFEKVGVGAFIAGGGGGGCDPATDVVAITAPALPLTLSTNGTAAFTATSSCLFPVNWRIAVGGTAVGATIDGTTGAFSAGATPGTITVEAYDGVSLASTLVTVTAPPPATCGSDDAEHAKSGGDDHHDDDCKKEDDHKDKDKNKKDDHGKGKNDKKDGGRH